MLLRVPFVVVIILIGSSSFFSFIVHCAASASAASFSSSSSQQHQLVPVYPEFAEPIRNVTVPLGREAVLSCVINDLGEYKVGWLRADDQTILSLHRKVVTHNPRVSVTHDEYSRTWNLHIRQIKETDQGCYMCQMNTAAMKKQLGCIQVQVPPDIDDDQSTGSDVTANEGDNVTLTCVARGKPAPRIVWRREDGQKIAVPTSSSTSNNNNNNHSGGGGGGGGGKTKSNHNGISSGGNSTHRERMKEVESFHGPVLRLYRVNRHSMAAYMCIASNDVPPAVSKRVPLNVNFAPLVSASMNVVGAVAGSDIRIKCSVESYPPSVNFWIKGRSAATAIATAAVDLPAVVAVAVSGPTGTGTGTGGGSGNNNERNILLTGSKYVLEEERVVTTGGGGGGYRTVMTLLIRDFRPAQDKGAYVCRAANSLGDAESTIQVYEVAKTAIMTSSSSTIVASRTTASATAIITSKTKHHHQHQQQHGDMTSSTPTTFNANNAKTTAASSSSRGIDEQSNNQQADRPSSSSSASSPSSFHRHAPLIFYSLIISTVSAFISSLLAP